MKITEGIENQFDIIVPSLTAQFKSNEDANK